MLYKLGLVGLLLEVKLGQTISYWTDDAVSVISEGDVALAIDGAVEIGELYISQYCTARRHRKVQYELLIAWTFV